MDYETIQRKAMILVRNEVLLCSSYAHSEMMHYIPSYQRVVYEALTDLELDEDNDIYEIWAVSPWLARQLEEKAEIVWEWGNIYYWGRMTTGQAIYMDNVIEVIVSSKMINGTSKVSQAMLGSL